MGCTDMVSYWDSQERKQREYEDSRRVTVGLKGKNATFTPRGKNATTNAEDGYVRIDGKTVTGYVPNFGKGGKVFYAYSFTKNAKLAA